MIWRVRLRGKSHKRRGEEEEGRKAGRQGELWARWMTVSPKGPVSASPSLKRALHMHIKSTVVAASCPTRERERQRQRDRGTDRRHVLHAS